MKNKSTRFNGMLKLGAPAKLSKMKQGGLKNPLRSSMNRFRFLGSVGMSTKKGIV